MVLAFHGKRVRVEEVRRRAGYAGGGLDARSLLEAARSFGLRARGVKVQSAADLRHLPRGSVLHWRFNHFVVFEGQVGERVEVVDPAVGRRRLEPAQVGRELTGVALLFEPGEAFEPGGRKGRVRGRWLQELRRHRGLLGRAVVMALLLQVFALAVPFLIGLLVDRVVPRGDRHLLWVLTGGLGLVVAFTFVATLVRSHLLLTLRTTLDARMTLDFLEHLLGLPWSFFQRRSAGDLLLRLHSNQTIREILTSGALSTLLDGALVVLYLLLITAASGRLALLVAFLGALQVLLFVAVRRRQRDLMSESLLAQAELGSYQVQMLAGIETVKAGGGEGRALDRWSHLFVDVLNVSLTRGRLEAVVEAVLGALRLASPVAVLVSGALLVLEGSLSLGVMLAVQALAAGFLVPLSALVTTALRLQLLGSYVERVEDVLETPREQAPGEGRPVPRLRGAVALDEVGFRYGERSPWVLRRVSCSIEPGQLVAVVGPSGAGKSTLAALLVGLHRPVEGSVAFDGLDLADLDLAALRRQVGLVPQEPFLFGASVHANVTLHHPDAPYARVVEAARRARIHEEVMALPMGYETVLADGGASLSGGQRQRLVLARALVGRPAILVLDEATSALDAATEAALHGELAALAATRIVIAHRLSTVRDADLILVLAGGRLVEHGRHPDLLAAGGVYARLVAAQMATGGTGGSTTSGV